MQARRAARADAVVARHTRRNTRSKAVTLSARPVAPQTNVSKPNIQHRRMRLDACRVVLGQFTAFQRPAEL